MGRRGRPLGEIDPIGGAAQYFAFCGRRLKKSLRYQDLAELAVYDKSALSRALSGRRVPTWEITEAIVRSLGADVGVWRRFWEEMKACEQDESRWLQYRREVVTEDEDAWLRPRRPPQAARFPDRKQIAEAARERALLTRGRADDPLHSEAFIVAVNGPRLRPPGRSQPRRASEAG